MAGEERSMVPPEHLVPANLGRAGRFRAHTIRRSSKSTIAPHTHRICRSDDSFVLMTVIATMKFSCSIGRCSAGDGEGWCDYLDPRAAGSRNGEPPVWLSGA